MHYAMYKRVQCKEVESERNGKEGMKGFYSLWKNSTSRMHHNSEEEAEAAALRNGVTAKGTHGRQPMHWSEAAQPEKPVQAAECICAK